MHHPEETMDTRELHERGLKLCKRIFGDEAVEARMRALGDFGAPLQEIIYAYAYGDIWSRPGLDYKIRSLVVRGGHAEHHQAADLVVEPGAAPDVAVGVGVDDVLQRRAEIAQGAHRSEERRVGKECRSR